MNMNEVIANRAAEIIATQCGKKVKLHPNDHVNLGQSSNDIFPTAIHIAVVNSLVKKLIPALSELIINLEEKSKQYSKLVKIGRTHLQDATPVTLGQEISGYVAQLRISEQAIKNSLILLYELAIGGTAVGTGLNTHAEFGDRVAAELSIRYRLPFVSIKNKFAALAGHEALLISHGALKVLAATLLKIANDIRWLASGPRCGLGEITIPENEPGSSIMPGKVNPTQAEAMIMLSYQVIANDLAITMGGASGNFELNVTKPLIAYSHLQSLRLLADGMRSFNQHCIKGLVANEDHIHQSVDKSLMLVTALVPHIGYDKAAHVAKEAHTKGQDLRTTAAALGYVSKEDYDRWVNILNMTNSQ
jgi:fumarate hydratase class II